MTIFFPTQKATKLLMTWEQRQTLLTVNSARFLFFVLYIGCHLPTYRDANIANEHFIKSIIYRHLLTNGF